MAVIEATGSFLVKMNNSFSKDYTALTQGTSGQVLLSQGAGANPVWNTPTEWDTAYAHSQDNSQAHSDYLINNGDDATTGTLTVANLTLSGTTISAPGILILAPGGTGALQIDSGGNARGNYAVDLQHRRVTATEVASGNNSFIGNGYKNTASSTYSFIGTGSTNIATGLYNFIGNGFTNIINVDKSFIGNGWYNEIHGEFGFIGCGSSNTITAGIRAVICGGFSNSSSADYNVIGGGYNNDISDVNSVICGGNTNTITQNDSVICGGYSNTISAQNGFIGSGFDNTVSGNASVIIGGSFNVVSGIDSFVSCGYNNNISGDRSVIAGGFDNEITVDYGFIGGGQYNVVSVQYGAVIGGRYNEAGSQWSVVSGNYAKTTLFGEVAQASGFFAVVGDAQTSVVVARNITTDATPKALFLNGAGGTQHVSLPQNTSWFFIIKVIARQTNSDYTVNGYHFEGLATRETGNISIPNQSLVSSFINDGAWACTISADTTNQAIKITVTGKVDENISWVARVELVQVTG